MRGLIKPRALQRLTHLFALDLNSVPFALAPADSRIVKNLRSSYSSCTQGKKLWQTKTRKLTVLTEMENSFIASSDLTLFSRHQ